MSDKPNEASLRAIEQAKEIEARYAGWRPIETAPKDGSEFLVCFCLQGNVKKLVNWNTMHGHWESKGEWLPGLMQNASLWLPIPEPLK